MDLPRVSFMCAASVKNLRARHDCCGPHFSLARAFMPGNRDQNTVDFQPASAGLLNRRL